MAGANNADLNGTRARLIRSGSWKHQRIVVIVPAGDTVPAKVVLSWMNLAFAPNNGRYIILAQGMEVGDAYSSAIEQVLANPELSQWEYVLTMEHDNAPPADGVLKLLEAMEEHPEFSVIGGLYYTKGPGGCAQIWGDASDPMINFRPQIPRTDGGLQECYGTGMGFTMYRLAMFKDIRLRRPWFVTQRKDGISTQDLYFASDARKFGFRSAVHTGVRVGHYDLRGDVGGIPDVMW